MGWGVNYESSYPALLERRVPQGFAVVNLGMNGYGVIGATEKSTQVGREFPPAAVVYLATDNDYQDDVVAARYAERPAAVRAGFDVLNTLRRYVELPNVWYAVRWWLYFRAQRNSPKSPWLDPTGASITFLPIGNKSDPNLGPRSKAALVSYQRLLGQQGIPLILIAHGSGAVAKDISAFGNELGIPSYRISFPPALRLRGEGHLNERGNEKLAELVYATLQRHNAFRGTS